MDRIVLITGGTKGIGKAVAQKFLRNGDTVVIVSRYHEGRTEEVMSELKELGSVCFRPVNVESYGECRIVMEEVRKRFGTLDVLVNAAGITGERKPFLDCNMEDLEKVIHINLLGSIYMARCAAELMEVSEDGVIINIGSICGFMANTENIGYHASKGGIRIVTEAMARELAPYGIRVLSVAPGWVDTGLMDQKAKEFGGTLHMKGRVIEPDEIADVVYLLSTPEAAVVNGTTVLADDGDTAFKGLKMKGFTKR